MKTILRICLYVVLFMVVFAFDNEAFAATNYPNGKAPKAGDILITNKNTTSFYTGHAAIVTDQLDVIEIAGVGKKERKISLKAWLQDYKLMDVVRHNNTTIAKNAGKEARVYWSKYPNSITYDRTFSYLLSNRQKVYCSKIVWQSYYYGNDGYQMLSGNLLGKYSPYKSSLITPYDLKKTKNSKIIY